MEFCDLKSKCIGIGVGFESTDQEVLDYYRKGVKVSQMQEAIDICKKYNLDITKGGTFMIGSPNETYESIIKS